MSRAELTIITILGIIEFYPVRTCHINAPTNRRYLFLRPRDKRTKVNTKLVDYLTRSSLPHFLLSHFPRPPFQAVNKPPPMIA